MTVRIVTDSTADIPREWVSAYQIEVVPNLIYMDGQSLEDEVTLSRKDFYERLPTLKELPTTGTASAGVYEELYAKLFQEGATEIFSIHPSALLSGILNAANTAAQAFPGRVHVIDSGQITLGLGFQVLAAAEAVMRKLPVRQVLSLLESMPARTKVIAMLDTLEYVRRSGRVSWARASLGTLLNIKPFVELTQGTVLRFGQARTRHKGLERLKEMILESKNIERLAILHTNAEEDAAALLQHVTGKFTETPLIVNVTTVIGSHVGPNCVGYAIVNS